MNWNSRLRSQLRRIWMQSPMRNEAIKNARIARGLYKCSICNVELKRGELQIDHITPAGTLIGDLGGFTERLLCDASGLRATCKPCHARLTAKNR